MAASLEEGESGAPVKVGLGCTGVPGSDEWNGRKVTLDINVLQLPKGISMERILMVGRWRERTWTELSEAQCRTLEARNRTPHCPLACKTGCINADPVLLSLVLNRWSRFYVTHSPSYMTTTPTTQTLYRYKEKMVGNCRRLCIFFKVVQANRSWVRWKWPPHYAINVEINKQLLGKIPCSARVASYQRPDEEEHRVRPWRTSRQIGDVLVTW